MNQDKRLLGTQKDSAYRAIAGLTAASVGILLDIFTLHTPTPTPPPRVQPYLELRKELEHNSMLTKAKASLDSLTNTPGFYRELSQYEQQKESQQTKRQSRDKVGAFLLAGGLTLAISEILRNGSKQKEKEGEGAYYGCNM